MSDAGKPDSAKPESKSSDTKTLLDEFRARMAPKAYRWRRPEPSATGASPALANAAEVPAPGPQ
ncbi:MAG TPA: hypothetical protein PLQ11_02575, partial [Beijerinckiaceae bacterium]|nr:hypothetical protein [Beijerinckiaceae bacterium]